MAPLAEEEISQLSIRVLQGLSQTPYACESLTRLKGGSANFVFRGILSQSLPISLENGTKSKLGTAKTIIVKHSTDFVAINRGFPLDVSRCLFEEFILNALESFSPTITSDEIYIKTPRHYWLDREANTQIHEEFSNSIDLKSILVSPSADDILSQPLATSIGRAVGSWMRSFYSWSAQTSQADLCAGIGKNDPMRKLKYLVTYDSFIPIVLEQCPELSESDKKILEEVKDFQTKQFQKQAGDEGGKDWGIIHGDFWAGNVLVPSTQPLDLQLQKPDGMGLFVIDWELAQFGHRAYDLGQMVGDLYERKHFHDVDSAMWLIEGFMDGYGQLGDDMAFQTAIHAGVHLICWWNRGPRKGLIGTPEQKVEVVRIGMELVVKGWEKDRQWLERSVLASLFKRKDY